MIPRLRGSGPRKARGFGDRDEVTAMRDFVQFCWQNKWWWITPTVLVLLLMVLVIVASSDSGIAPFVYTLF